MMLTGNKNIAVKSRKKKAGSALNTVCFML